MNKEHEEIAVRMWSILHPDRRLFDGAKGNWTKWVGECLRIAEDLAWKDASVELPDTYRDVQIWDGDDVKIGYYKSEPKSWLEYGNDDKPYVIKWRELPTPPRKEGGE